MDVEHLWLEHLRPHNGVELFPRKIGISIPSVGKKHIPQKTVHNKGQYLAYLHKFHKSRDCYSRIMSLKQEREEIIDVIFMEFDEPDSVERARKGKILYYCLQSLDVDPYVVYSGNKSYHFYVPFENVHLENAKIRIRKWVRGLPIDFIDPKVVGDIRRLSRLPCTVHSKTGKFACVIPNDVFVKGLKEIDAVTRRLSSCLTVTDPVFPNNVDVIRQLLDIDVETYERRLASSKNAFVGSFDFYPRCIQCALEDLKTTGKLTHSRRLHLASFMNKIDKSEEEVCRLFKDYAEDYVERKTVYQVGKVFSSDLKCYSCANYAAMDLCPLPKRLRESCPFHPSINIYL